MSGTTIATVTKIVSYTDTIRCYTLRLDKMYRFLAGQFVQLTLELVSGSDYWPESRTYSIGFFDVHEKTIELIIKNQGIYSNRIFNELALGSTCTLKYPYGDFTLPEDDDFDDIVCIAGGTGISPFFSFILELQSRSLLHKMRLFYSVKCVNDIIRYEFLHKYLGERMKLFTTRENSALSYHRRIEICDVVDESNEHKITHFYISGSHDFIEFFVQKLSIAGVKNIHYDFWK